MKAFITGLGALYLFVVADYALARCLMAVGATDDIPSAMIGGISIFIVVGALGLLVQAIGEGIING